MANCLFNKYIRCFLVVMVLLCTMTISALAQNNPQKINDKLYPLYVKAYNMRKKPQGIAFADSLRRKAIAIGDRYGEINALTVNILHEFYKPQNLNAVDRTVKAVLDKTKQYGMQHYYYYAVSLKETYLIREQKYLEAFLYLQEQKNLATKHGHQEGIQTLYRMDGVLQQFRSELSQAINSYQKAINSYKDSNYRRFISREYLSISDCYRMMGDYDNLLKAAKKALEYCRSYADTNNIYIYECYGNFMLGHDKEFIEKYSYLQKNKTKLENSYIIMNNAIKACKAIYDGRYNDAESIIDSIAKISDDESYRLYAALCQRKNDYAKGIEYLQKLLLNHYENGMAIFKSDKKSMKNIFIDQHLKAEQQQIINKKTQLELSNTQMLLRNSSLELEHGLYATQLAQAAEDKQHLSFTTQQLLAKQLADSIATQQLEKKEKDRRMKQEKFISDSILTFALLALIMTFAYIWRKKNIAKKIEEGNKKLNSSIKELFAAKDKAIQSEQMKTLFIQNMSHEIRTPLNAIVGFSQLLTDMGEEIDTEEKKKMTKHIADNSDMLITIVNDILDITDLENNSFTMSKEMVGINDLCRETIETVRHRLAPGVEMKFTSDVDDSCTTITDRNRVRQVLINMLTNAEKNTTHGSITLSCSAAANPGMLTFAVTDTGIGVPKDKQAEIFERFKKLDSFKQGTGLGLDICRTIATKLGGSINIDPEYTGGARFWFTIPFEK